MPGPGWMVRSQCSQRSLCTSRSPADRNDSGDRALHVVDLADVPPTVVVAKDDDDDRFGQASWRWPRALNLDAIVSADCGLAAVSPVTMIVLVLTIGAHQLRAAHRHRNGARRRRYPTNSLHVSPFTGTSILESHHWERRVAQSRGTVADALFLGAVQVCTPRGPEVYSWVHVSNTAKAVTRVPNDADSACSSSFPDDGAGLVGRRPTQSNATRGRGISGLDARRVRLLRPHARHRGRRARVRRRRGRDIALAITLALAMRPIGAVIFGLMADRYGRRLPLMLNVIFYAVISVLSGLAPSYGMFIVPAHAVRHRHGRRMGRRRVARARVGVAAHCAGCCRACCRKATRSATCSRRWPSASSIRVATRTIRATAGA